ncbi:UL16-binding protein 1-like isoform X1 [Ursus americanus]|uniref:UL16-binding protein 1-like isoform X1 n=1 Tax=Ursus americanus TaxID=9643 RepID=UPI001E67C21D|nr:UL16-binding protein 1-like isoform X1 [Ursus americanus]
MEPAAAGFPRRLLLLFGLLLFLLLLRETAAAPRTKFQGATRGGRDTDVLCLLYDFSIISPARPGQPWYKIEGQINGNTFVYYDSQSKELKPVGRLGLQLKDIPFWERQKETLEDSCNELKTKPLEITAETSSNRDFCTLQGRLTCERGANRERRSFWRFHLNGQITPDFELENRKWTVDDSGDQRLKDMLDSDRELTEFLMRVSDGDCMSWLQQVSEHLEEMRETTETEVVTKKPLRTCSPSALSLLVGGLASTCCSCRPTGPSMPVAKAESSNPPGDRDCDGGAVLHCVHSRS